MSREGFLADIIEHPDDDAPRLIYADWLDDHGESDRAELIRLQIESARLPEGDPHAADLDTRAEELLAEHETEWLGEWSERLVRWTFRRGFLDEITIDGGQFLQHGEELFQRFPIDRVRFVNAEGECLRGGAVSLITQSSAFAHVRRLDASEGWSAEWAQFVAQATHASHLKELNLSAERDSIDRSGLLALCEAGHLAGLEALDISTEGNPLGDDIIDVLAGAVFTGQLRSLNLDGQDITDAGGRAWAGACGAGALNIDGQDITDAGAQQLAQNPVFKQLERLRLAGCPMLSFLGVKDLLTSAHLSRLRELCLGCNLDIASLASIGTRAQLTHLDLWMPSGIFFLRSSWSAFASSPLASNVRHLGLADGGVGEEFVDALASGLPALRRLAIWGGTVGDPLLTSLARTSRRLTALDLSRCGVSALGIRAMANSPVLRELAHIRLWWDEIWPPALIELINSSYLTTRLRRLEIRGSNLSRGGFDALARCPRMAGLTYLDVTGCRLDKAGLNALLASPYLARLTTFHLGSVSDTEVLKALSLSPGLPRLREVVIGSRSASAGIVALRKRFGARLIVYHDD
jgi:uncharacterized protein (TIGR02996 family)